MVSSQCPKSEGSGRGRSRKRRRSGGAAGGYGWRGDVSCKVKKDDPTHDTMECTSDLMVDFDAFAAKYPEFANAWEELKHRRYRGQSAAAPAAGAERQGPSTATSLSTSFSTHVDASFNLALTRAILQSNFNVSLPSMPEGYLCPPVPNRLNYVIWLNTLLRQSRDSRYFEPTAAESGGGGCGCSVSINQYHYRGIDIGCGASCIFPLLLSTNKFCPNEGNEDKDSINNDESKKWKVFATDIDAESIKSAVHNVQANGLGDRIEVSLVPVIRRQMMSDNINEEGANDDDMPGPVRISVEAFRTRHNTANSPSDDDAVFDFCMTNPPFYGTEAEATADRRGDGRSRTDMNLSEGVYPGGEIGFVRDMIADSVYLSNTITWFTSMLAKKSSLVELERELRIMLGRGAVRTATFVQGKTTRWAIAWTHRQVALCSPVTRVMGGLQIFEVCLTTSNSSGGGSGVDEVVSRLSSYCQWIASTKGLDLEFTVMCAVAEGKDFSAENGAKTCTIGEKIVASTNGSSSAAFLVDILICNLEATSSKEDETRRVEVQLHCFSHSPAGSRAIEKIRSGIEGEINRSNRRWRRMLAKEQDVTK